MVSTIVWRTRRARRARSHGREPRVPVINALCDDYHPCQLLADLLTVKEHKGALQGLTMAYLGDARQQHGQLLPAGRRDGGHARPHRRPGGLPARPAIVAAAEDRAAETGGSVLVTVDAAEALAGADVVATDTWVSMGQEAEKEARMKLFRAYSVDADAMKLARAGRRRAALPAGLPGLRDRRGRH